MKTLLVCLLGWPVLGFFAEVRAQHYYTWIRHSNDLIQVTTALSAAWRPPTNGYQVQIQFTDSLSLTNGWQPLTNFVFTDHYPKIALDSVTNSPQRFYRLRRIP